MARNERRNARIDRFTDTSVNLLICVRSLSS